MVSDTVGGPALHAVRRRATNVVPAAPARLSPDSTFRLAYTNVSLAASRSDVEADVLLPSSKKPGRHSNGIRDRLERKLLRMSTILLFVGSVGWCWPVLSELRSLISVSPAVASIHPHVSYCQRLNRCRGKADSEIGKLDPFNKSIYAPSAARHVTRRSGTRLGRESAARIVARERSGTQTRIARHSRKAAVKHTAKEPKPSLKPSVRLASLEGSPPPVVANPSHIPSNVGTLTSLVGFETAPFPYHGSVPNSGQPFLNAGAEGHWGHVNFRGDVLWESQTFRDDHVLLHIPPGFDPNVPRSWSCFFTATAPISPRTYATASRCRRRSRLLE
jgi:hypothetical protein